MAKKHEVKSINRTGQIAAHERIRDIGGCNSDGTFWHLGQGLAIGTIENGFYTFYVSHNGSQIDVMVARTQDGYKYLKAVEDSEQPDILLSLPNRTDRV